ncbi:multiple sugar transport system permease protein [Reinekea marinisedimentorum]|uniref:Multiple sugar transport system permease protein n=2 Tax=Reinekea marinisedimentorum TaxID=230495 RepID=A0A4V2UK74_9GAMM|nr:multiple sugar transport system permease protein [Reinekea marinisedimentorum]
MLLLLFCLFPFVQILSTSLKHQADWGNPSLIPAQLNFEAYKELLGFSQQEVELPETIRMMLESPAISEEQRAAIIKKFTSTSDIFPFGRYMLNTFVISMVTAFLSTLIATFAAYALSRLKFRGRNAFSNTVMFVYMVGGVLLMVPLYQMAVSTGLASTVPGTLICLLLIYLVQTLPVAIYMLGNYFRTIPFSLEEAAMIDGYSRTSAIFAVIIPLSRPMLLTVMFYCFVIAWNEYLFASVFLKQYQDFHTLPLALQTLFSSKNAIWDRIMAASMLTLIPVVIAFSVANRFISSGGTAGGVKE